MDRNQINSIEALLTRELLQTHFDKVANSDAEIQTS